MKWTNASLDVGILSILDFLDSRGCNCYLFIIFWLLLVVTGWFFYVWYFVYTSCIHRKDVSPWRSFNRLALFAYPKKNKNVYGCLLLIRNFSFPFFQMDAYYKSMFVMIALYEKNKYREKAIFFLGDSNVTFLRVHRVNK